jgi:hypothetical protein
MVMEKIADLRLGSPDHPLRRGGMFIGTQAEEVKAMMREHKTLNNTRAAWTKKYPNDYVTAAYHHDKDHKGPAKVHVHIGLPGGAHQSGFYSTIFQDALKKKAASAFFDELEKISAAGEMP